MRNNIICRFETEDDFNEFCSINNLELTKNTTYYNFMTKERKEKKTIARKTSKVETWKSHWVGLPEYISNKQVEYAKINFDFNDDIELAKSILQQNITDKTTSVWFPKLIPGKHSRWRVIGGDKKPQYPIYIISKNRAETCYTSRFLVNMNQEHYIVVEEDQYDEYKKFNDSEYCKIITLPQKYLDEYDTCDDLGDTKSKGPGAARNFCWDHSISNNFKRHWVMDDNANEGFFYMWRNKKIKARTSTIFRVCEDFVDRYKNIGIAGLNYAKFCKESDKTPAYVLNTRIYSFLLIDNSIPFRWRGRYNEDTDLSLRVLKSGLCTLQFNTFLAGKATTQKIQGGNTEEFYSKEGTLPKSQMLESMHPDVAKVVWKFSRWHHQVDYSGFTQELQYVEMKDYDNIDYYGLKIIITDEARTDDNEKYLLEKYKDNECVNNGDLSQ